jgi:hypothetical protein
MTDMQKRKVRFVAIDLNDKHIYEQTRVMLDAGAYRDNGSNAFVGRSAPARRC